jgi:hypothetical protein
MTTFVTSLFGRASIGGSFDLRSENANRPRAHSTLLTTEDRMNSYFKLVLLTAIFMLAITFTISCSDDGDEGGGGGSMNITESYALKNVTDDSFEYVEVYEWYDCKEGGNVEKKSEEDTERINYSINNNVLDWRYRWSDDSLNFAGASNNLTGTWTRTKNKNASCKTRTDDDGDTYLRCKKGWEIVRAEFTTSTVKIISDVCVTDEIDGSIESGWKYTATNCNSWEMSKEAEKVTGTITLSSTGERVSITETYKGKTCTYREPNASQRQSACKKAWDEYGSTDMYWDDYYYDFLWSDYDKCIEQFPISIFGGSGGNDDDEPSYGSVLAKPLLKKQAKQR